MYCNSCNLDTYDDFNCHTRKNILKFKNIICDLFFFLGYLDIKYRRFINSNGRTTQRSEKPEAQIDEGLKY